MEICHEYKNFRLLPQICRNLTHSLKNLGEPQDSYKHYIENAYYGARMMGYFKTAELIQKDAEENLSIFIVKN